MPVLKKFLSYLMPINVYRKKSAVSKSLEVTWANGELVLDSQNTNYSYGSLQRVLRIGLKHIGFDTVAKMENILVLGVAGGSVIKTLVDEIGCKGNIIGVEIDPEIVAIANQWFGLDKIRNLQIVVDDAFEFVLKTKQRYDLIIVDVFRDATMPDFLFERFFADRIGFLLQTGGYILFNTMTLNGKHDTRNQAYVDGFDRDKFNISLLPRLEEHNELIVIRKNG